MLPNGFIVSPVDSRYNQNKISVLGVALICGKTLNPIRKVVLKVMDNKIPDNLEPEDIPEAITPQGGHRLKAVILLLIFLIPILLAVYELLSHQISGNFVQVVQPHIPQLDTVITF